MLKIKQPQVLIALIDGVGSAAWGIYLQQNGHVYLGLLAMAVMFAACAVVLIRNQDDKHTDSIGYFNIGLFLISLGAIALAFGWIVALVFAAAFVAVGTRYYSTTIGPNV